MTEYFWLGTLPHDEMVEDIEEGNLHLAGEKLRSYPSHQSHTPSVRRSRLQWVDWQFDELVATKGIDWFPVGNGRRYTPRERSRSMARWCPFTCRASLTAYSRAKGYILMELKTGKWKGRRPRACEPRCSSNA